MDKENTVAKKYHNYLVLSDLKDFEFKSLKKAEKKFNTLSERGGRQIWGCYETKYEYVEELLRNVDGTVPENKDIVLYEKESNMMTLSDFVARVNELAQAECDRINTEDPNAPFKAVHHPFHQSMLEIYHKEAFTPREILREITEDAITEGMAEAAGS